MGKQATAFRPRKFRVGEAVNGAKLKERDIPRIRELIDQGFCIRCVAKMYEVSHWTLRDVVRGKTWRHVA